MKTITRLATAATTATLFALVGCSAGMAASRTVEDGTVAGGASEQYTAPDAAPAGKPGDNSGTTIQPQIARTASISLTVTDVHAAAKQLRQLAASVGGLVTSENLVIRDGGDNESRPISTLVISVSADKLDSTLDQLSAVGTITGRVISSDDVTTQVVDVAARIKTLEGSIDRLRELGKRAGSVAELAQLESELTNRTSERDSLVAQQQALAGRVAQSPITITLRAPKPASEIETTGFIGGLMAGWNALVSSSRMLLTVLGAVLPFAAVLGLVLVPVVLWRRRQRSRRAGVVDEHE